MSRTPTGTSVPSIRAISVASRLARWSPRFGDPHQDQVVRALVALQDLVGDPGEGRRTSAGVQQLRRSYEKRPPGARGALAVVRHLSLPSRPRGTGLKGWLLVARSIRVGSHPVQRAVRGPPIPQAYTRACPRRIGGRTRREGGCLDGMSGCRRGHRGRGDLRRQQAPDIARNVGRAQGEFKKGLKEGAVDESTESPTESTEPTDPRRPSPSPPRRPHGPPRGRSARGCRSRTGRDSSDDSSVAASTASLIATEVGMSGRCISSNTAIRRIVRSRVAIRATVHPSECSSSSGSISARCVGDTFDQLCGERRARSGRPRASGRAPPRRAHR